MAVLGDLALQNIGATTEDREKVEQKLAEFLPQNSFFVLLRRYVGDTRMRTSSDTRMRVVITADRNGRSVALAKRSELETAGFIVASDGSISLPG